MISKVVQKLAKQVPDHSNWVYAAQAAGAAALGTPVVGAIPQVIQGAGLWLPPEAPLIIQGGVGLVTVSLGSMILSKLAVKNKWWLAKDAKAVRKLEITIGGMTFDEKSLFTNIIAFGSIGSGKTAAVIYPILDLISGLYKEDNPLEPTAKWGGFVLDVKGDFHEAVIWALMKHGRDVLNDLVVIRPDNDYYILEFEELTTKEHFLVSCMGGTSMQECDLVLNKAVGPEDVVGTDLSNNKVIKLPNGDVEALSSFMFSDRGTFRRAEIHKLLAQLEFDVRGLSVRWLGWREDKSGKLVRVTHTDKRVTQYAKDANGNQITTNKPQRLRYLGVHSVSNGLTYNLVSKNAASTEAAGRIMAVAEVTGNSMGGDNAYWSNASEKHIAACIELFRQVEGPMGRECSVNEIQKFTTNEKDLKEYVTKLKAVIRRKQTEGASSYELLLLRNLEDYFEGEWLRHDPKTKGNIQSCVTNLFGDVTRNEQLIKTFCQPSRFSFEDCLNDGKIYTLVLSAYPNAQMLIGTCMKLDFQQVVLKRTQAAPVNKNRFLMFLADEYQFFITTSGGGKTGGDEKFLSVARQSRIFNLVCTQAVTSLLAVQKDENKINAFLQCFGSRVFLQNLDEKTNKLAEQTLGQFWMEKEDQSGPDLKLSSALGEGKSASVSRRTEKQHRFEASYFTQLAPFEAVLFNKERPTGRKMVKANLKPEKFWDKREMANATNDFYQSYIENRTYQLGIAHLLDPRDNVKEKNEAETAQRVKGILRSWREGVPIGVRAAPLADTPEAAAAAAPEEEAGVPTAEGEDVAAETLPEAAEDDLNFSQDDLKSYVDSHNYFSDYKASQASDPFFKSTSKEITAQVGQDELTANAQDNGGYFGELDKAVSQLPGSSTETPTASGTKGVEEAEGEADTGEKEHPNLMENRRTIPDGIQMDGEMSVPPAESGSADGQNPESLSEPVEAQQPDLPPEAPANPAAEEDIQAAPDSHPPAEAGFFEELDKNISLLSPEPPPAPPTPRKGVESEEDGDSDGDKTHPNLMENRFSVPDGLSEDEERPQS